MVTDGEGERFSIRSMKADIAEGKMFEDLKFVCGWTDAQVNTLRTQLKDLVEYMIPYRDILDMNHEMSMKKEADGSHDPDLQNEQQRGMSTYRVVPSTSGDKVTQPKPEVNKNSDRLSERTGKSVSNRHLLANAFEGIVNGSEE